MKPVRVIMGRRQSPPARHTVGSLHGCNAPLRLCVELNPFRRAGRDDQFVTERCDGCGSVTMVYGVLPEPRLAP